MSALNTITASNSPIIICIGGMHRNGTSTVTKALSALGVALGDSLMPADSGNPTGYWEHTEAVAINEAVLQWLQIQWDSPLIASKTTTALPEPLLERGIDFIQQQTSSVPFAFKDPRTSRLLPFWQTVMQESKERIDARYVITLRNPLDSARSLARRNGIPVIKGLALWIEHMLSMAATVDWDNTIVVEYETLLQHPHNTLHKLHDDLVFLNVLQRSATNTAQETSIEDGIEDFVTNFLDVKKCLSISERSELEEYSAQLPLLIPLYDALQHATREPVSAATQSWFATCWESYGLGSILSNTFSKASAYETESTPACEVERNSSCCSSTKSFCLQLYYDSGSGFNEHEKLHQMVPHGAVKTTFELPQKQITRIRLDTGDTPCVCHLDYAAERNNTTSTQIFPKRHSALSEQDSVYLFQEDPQIEFTLTPDATAVDIALEYIELPATGADTDHYNALIAQLLQAVAPQKQKTHAVEKKAHRLTTQIDELSVESKQHRATIADLTVQLEESQAMHERNAAHLAQKYEGKLKALQQHISKIEKDLTEQATYTAHQRSYLENATQSAAGLRGTVQQIRHENESLRFALEEIRNSITWRTARFFLQPIEHMGWFKKLHNVLKSPKRTNNTVDIALPHTAPVIPERMEHPLCIVIPVYNGVTALENCFNSLMSSYPAPEKNVQFLVINDASPDPAVENLFAMHAFCARPDVTITANRKNLGFTGTANRGITMAEKQDIVLLNSDTEIWARSFHVLQHTAYRNSQIASVTPFTNRGSIASLLNWPDGSDTIFQVPVRDLTAIVEQTAIATPVQSVPTGVGFCMYIKRSALNKVGMLDEKTFGKGYGEENDWSQRAIKKGFHHVICTETYVHHAETQSFTSEEKKQALTNNLAKLNKKHRGYSAQVERYIHSNALDTERNVLLWNILGRSKHYAQRKTILHVLHKSPMNHLGGTELHVRTLTAAQLEHGNIEALWLTPDVDGLRLNLIVPPFESVFSMPIPKQLIDYMLPSILQRADLVHIHHLEGFTESTMAALTDWTDCPKVFTVHDFNCVCPSWNLLRDGEYCASQSIAECTGCEHEHGMFAHRVQYARLLTTCETVIAPSDSTAQIIQRIFKDEVPNLSEKLSTHSHMLPIPVSEPKESRSEAPRVVFLGGLTEAKGSKLVLKSFEQLSSLGFVCEVWGESNFTLPNGVILRRYFSREELHAMSQQYPADIVCIPSIWPETFCYTAYEALCILKAPIICGPHGNPADIVKAHNVGTVMNNCTSSELTEKITHVADNHAEFQQAVNSFIPEMLTKNYAQQYCNVFTQLFS